MKIIVCSRKAGETSSRASLCGSSQQDPRPADGDAPNVSPLNNTEGKD